MLKPFCSCVPT